MFILVLGHNKSGKSRFAEQLAARMRGSDLVYLATFIPVGEGITGAATIERHRAQRAGLGFATVEQPLHVGEAPLLPGATVLLEDVSNLLGNNLFCEGAHGSAETVLQDITRLAQKCGQLVAVSISGLALSEEYDDATNRYIGALNVLNSQMEALADVVVEMKNGQPHVLKGQLPV